MFCVILCTTKSERFKIKVSHLHLDVEDAPLLLDLFLDGSHGLVQDRQTFCALQGGGRHHVARRSDQVDLRQQDHNKSLVEQPKQFSENILKNKSQFVARLDGHGFCGAAETGSQSFLHRIDALIPVTRHLDVYDKDAESLRCSPVVEQE